MPPIAAPARPQMAVPNRRISDVVLALVLAVPLLAAAVALSRTPTHVDAVTIRNPAEYRLNVGLAGGEGEWALPLGSVDRGTFLVVDEVLDRADSWVFRFTYGGVDAAEVRMTRAELAAADWTVTVPATVGERLRAAALQPTPPPSPDDPQRL